METVTLIDRVASVVRAKHTETYGCACAMRAERRESSGGTMYPIRYVFECGRR